MRVKRWGVVVLGATLLLGVGMLQAQVKVPEAGLPQKDIHGGGGQTVNVPADEIEGFLLDKVLPTEYPAAAQAKGIAGTVTMAATIGTDGLVKEIVAESGPEELRASALAAARQWKFRPYKFKGEIHEVKTTLVIKFELGS